MVHILSIAVFTKNGVYIYILREKKKDINHSHLK